MAVCDAILDGRLELNAMINRGRDLIGQEPDWLIALCVDLVTGELPADSSRLLQTVTRSQTYQQFWHHLGTKPKLVLRHFPRSLSHSRAHFIDRNAPRLNTTQDLCRLLEIDDARLYWLATNHQNHTLSKGAQRHYYYQWVDKRLEPRRRLLEIPKSQLKLVQTKIYQRILKHVAVHDACHGYMPGKSIVTFTKPHIGKQWLLKVDLQNFFTYIRYPRIYGVFSAFGYPRHLLQILTRLTTHAVDAAWIIERPPDFEQQSLLRIPHLPQGAPSSPRLANCAAYSLDCRLQAFAHSVGLNYTRYADDLLFSSNQRRTPARYLPFIAKIAIEEGFSVNFHKCKTLSQAQQQKAAGIVLNQTANIPRREYQRIKAILHNCIHFGVNSQKGDRSNFKAYIRGKISFVTSLNAEKGQKLHQLYNAVNWPD